MAAPHIPSAVSRRLEPSYASNRFAIAGFVVAALVLGTKALITDDLTPIGALFAAVGVFLGWAAGRELDPGTPAVAALGMVLALVIAVFVLIPASTTTTVVFGAAMGAVLADPAPAYELAAALPVPIAFADDFELAYPRTQKQPQEHQGHSGQSRNYRSCQACYDNQNGQNPPENGPVHQTPPE